MEVVFSVLFVISLFGNYFQHEKIERLEVEVETYKESTKSNYKALLTAEEANEEYARIIVDFENAIASCSGDRKRLLDRINNWEEATRLKDAAIEDLKKKLATVNYGDNCRVPDGVDFQAGS